MNQGKNFKILISCQVLEKV